MIRGGAEYDLGIYITGVDQGSAAEFGGLKVWLKAFLNLSHGYFYIWGVATFKIEFIFVENPGLGEVLCSDLWHITRQSLYKNIWHWK